MKLNKKTLAVSVATLVIVGGTSAFAYFTSQGAGEGSGKVATAETGVVTLNAEVLTDLFPGGAAGPVDVLASNSSTDHAYTVENVVVDTAVGTAGNGVRLYDTNGDEHIGGCNAAWFNPTAVGPGSGSPVSVPANTTTPSVDVGDLSVTMTEANVNQDACQGLVVKVALKTATL